MLLSTNLKGSFNSLLDSHMNLAKECMEIIKDSQNFTLTNYSLQESFYNKYKSYWNDLRDKVIDQIVSNNKNCNNLKRMFCIDDQLNKLIDKKVLNFTHLFVAYYAALKIGYYDCNYRRTLDGVLYSIDVTHTYLNIEDEVTKLNELNNGYVVVPFVSQGGLYGINTWLYMHFNGYCLNGISTDPFAVHNGGYQKNPFYTAQHDELHCEFASKCTIEKYNIFHRYNKTLYSTIMCNQDAYTLKEIIFHLICIYVFEHEISKYDVAQIIDWIVGGYVTGDKSEMNAGKNRYSVELRKFIFEDALEYLYKYNILKKPDISDTLYMSFVYKQWDADEEMYNIILKYWKDMICYYKNNC